MTNKKMKHEEHCELCNGKEITVATFYKRSGETYRICNICRDEIKEENPIVVFEGH